MKKLFLRIAIVILALVIVAGIVVFLSLNSLVKRGVETVGPRLTKVEMRLGGAKLSPFSGSGRLTDLFVGNPEGYKTPSAFKMNDIKVGVEVGSLLSDTMVVNEVNIQSPEITFEGGLTGNNLSKILDNLEAATGGKSDQPAQPGKKSEKKFFVKDVVLQGAKIHVSITGLGGQSATLPLPDLHLQNIGSKDKGVSAAELAEQIMKPLLASVTKAVADNAGNLGKGVQDIGKGAVDQVDKTAQGLKGLFKK